MAYIGQSIKNGTFTTLDTSGNTYNGSNTAFALGTQVGSPAQLLVSHDGVIQKPGTDYELSSGGTAITFTTAPASGASIFIVEISGAVGGPLGSDLNGSELILDADGDTSIHASTDDQIDIKIAGADDFKFTANAMNVLSGSTLTVDSGATLTVSGSTNLANTPAFFVTKSANQNVATGTATTITWDVESYDTASAFASNEFTVPSGQGGKYFIYCSLQVSGGSANDYLMNRIMVNDTLTQYTISRFAGAGGLNGNINVSLNLSEGDVVKIAASHNTGSTEVIDYDKLTWFGGFKIIGA
jgi:hypothetical protein